MIFVPALSFATSILVAFERQPKGNANRTTSNPFYLGQDDAIILRRCCNALAPEVAPMTQPPYSGQSVSAGYRVQVPKAVSAIELL